MERDQMKQARKSSQEQEATVKKGTKSTVMKKTTDSDSLRYDSITDGGYKSGDIDSGKITSKKGLSHTTSLTSQTLKKEHSIRFDSGLGSDLQSPLPSESDFAYEGEDETLSKKTVLTETEAQKSKSSLLWQDIYRQDQDGDTILHLAVVEARSDIIFPLIRLAPHPDALDICNDLCQTPLHLATLMGKSNIVRRLVAAGATLDIEDHRGNTSLHIASRNGDLDCVQSLLEPLTEEEILDSQCLYCVYPQLYDLSHLINLKNYDGHACIHLAAIGGFKKVLECLYDHGANVNDQEGKSGKTALHIAVENANYELVQILVCKCYANVNAKNYAGKTPIHVAWTLYKTHRQQLNILEFLKKNSSEKWESPSGSESSSDESECLETHVSDDARGK